MLLFTFKPNTSPIFRLPLCFQCIAELVDESAKSELQISSHDNICYNKYTVFKHLFQVKTS